MLLHQCCCFALFISAITESNYEEINQIAQTIFKEDQTYQRLVLTKEEALRLFGDNPFKVILKKCLISFSDVDNY